MRINHVALLSVAAVLLAAVAPVHAASVSVFAIEQADIVLTGFGAGGVGSPGPDALSITNIVGTYDMDIPPAGGSWGVYVSGWLGFDFNTDGVVDIPVTFNEYIGAYPSPGPSTSWGPTTGMALGDIVVDPVSLYGFTLGGYTLQNVVVSYDIDVDGPYPSGPFGPGAHADFTLMADNLATTLNADLALLDLPHGANGVMDGWLSGEITVTAVPEPMTMLAVGMAVAGLGGYIRKRRIA